MKKVGICLWCGVMIALEPIEKDELIEIQYFGIKPELPLTVMHQDCPYKPKE